MLYFLLVCLCVMDFFTLFKGFFFQIVIENIQMNEYCYCRLFLLFFFKKRGKNFYVVLRKVKWFKQGWVGQKLNFKSQYRRKSKNVVLWGGVLYGECVLFFFGQVFLFLILIFVKFIIFVLQIVIQQLFFLKFGKLELGL